MVPEESMKGCTNASNDEDIIIIHLICFACGEEHWNIGRCFTAFGWWM